MKYLKIVPFVLFSLLLNCQVQASNELNENKNTAESVFAFAGEMKSFDVKVLKAEMKGLSFSEKRKLIKMAIKDVKAAELNSADKPSVGLYILAVIYSPLAVGIQTHWGMPTLYNVLWWFLGGVPGMVHAFIVLGR